MAWHKTPECLKYNRPDPSNLFKAIGMNKEKILYLIDGSAYIYRAYHAIRGLSNSKGLPTNAVFGFTRILLKLIEDKSPEYLVMFFDAKGPTFRHDIYSDYKANRPPMPEDLSIQIPFIKEVTRGFNIQLFDLPGYEADDLIGTVKLKAENAGYKVVMVTGDKDFMQLVSDQSTIWDPMKDKIIDSDTIQKEFDLKPEQIIDAMGLSGDKADNIPGVPGIGMKTAAKLIKTFGNMESLYKKIDTITKKKQQENLIAYKDQAFLSKELVTINTAAPISFTIEDFSYSEPDRAKLSRLFKDLEFRQLQKDFPVKSDLSKKNYIQVLDRDTFFDLIKQLEAAEIIAVDTETTSKAPMKARLVGLSFAIKPHEAFYIPCAHDYLGAPEQLNLSFVLTALKPLLENPDISKVGQNIKYDCMVLVRHGIHLDGIVFDTMLASYLMNPSKRVHSLDQIALDLLDHATIEYEEVAGKGKNTVTFNQVPLEKAGPYASEDADITMMAFNALKPMIEEAGLTGLMENVELPLVPVLMNMEMSGISVDKDMLRDLSGSFETRLSDLEANIYLIAGETFNIRSSQQLGTILFEKLKLPVQKKTKKKTGYSTDVGVLTTLADQHELPALILTHRTLAKLKSTYTDALLEIVNPETGRIHTSYNQTITATGRLSSSNPNLQNIPVKTDEGREIRRAFIPRDGWVLLAADYSQIELRILAHYSEDSILVNSFINDEDIHTRTATEVFQTFPELVMPDLRRQAKVINFGIVYGMSPFGLSRELGISTKMAKAYIDNYFSRYKGVKEYMNRTIESARSTGKTDTLLGRIRILPDIKSSNKNLREAAERIAINTPIQGTAADLIKIAMIQLASALKEKGYQAVMLLSVHDEIVFEVPPDELEALKILVRKIMEGVWDLNVPLKVNLASGNNWAEAH